MPSRPTRPEAASAAETPSSSDVGGALARIAGTAAVLLLVLDRTAWALPSPDVVVNLFASAAQVLGLLTVVLGKWFFGGRRRAAAARSASGYRVAFLVCAGLLLLSLVGWGLSSARQADLRTARLQRNLNRESKEDGKKVVDLSLKETGFGEQQQRRDGVQAEWLQAALERDEPLQMLDIRESEEVEMGIIRGVRAVRFPDLMKEPELHLDRQRTVYLFCANGNRSCEMSSFLAERGYEARFLVGGYEKWVAEERPLETPGGVPRTELRALPDFANKDVLLDTPDVLALMEERDVLFVDVRYPGDFEAYGHLPGAVNLTMRKLATPELEAALRALPKKPVIVPCYDRRSSFFGQILGLRISRMGGEFLGRYTVPEEFSAPKKDKPHVAAWKARHEDRSLLTVASAPLAGALEWIREHASSLALAILGLVFLIRAAILPLTLRSDRDRVVQARLGPRLKALKAELRGDPDAIARATAKLLREHGIRPVLGFATAIAQLLLFTGFFSVVSEASRGSEEAFLWIPALGAPDPGRVLPGLVGLLIVAQLLVTARTITRWRVAWVVAAGVGLFALVAPLSAGANLYLVANLALLLLQSVLVARFLSRKDPARREREGRRFAEEDVVPLRLAQAVPGCGGKASRLAALLEAGLPVPDGFVVRGRAIEAWRSTGTWSTPLRARVQREHARLGTERVAVRSSGANEDGSARSYAGVFESILDVGSRDLLPAIERVAQSLSSERALAYSELGAETGSIVVQSMVRAEYAGVLFTEHPGHSGTVAIELVAGLGDGLVSGQVDPLAFRVGRASGRVLDGKKSPIDLAPLIEIGRRVEALFGRPQDVEWAYARGRFHVLQARDITRRCGDGEGVHAARERERARLVAAVAGAPADAVVLAQNELSELLPEPTPFSLAWMEEMWAYGGCADLACRSLGIPYDVLPDSAPFVVGAFGSLYVNRVEESRRLRSGPGTVTAFRLSRSGESIERSWREDYLPGFLRGMRLSEALDLSRLSTDEVVDLYSRTSDEFLHEDYVRVETINVAADFYFKGAMRQLRKRGLDPAEYLSDIPETVVHEAMERLQRFGRKEGALDDFMSFFGHRSPHDYELAEPRYRETPSVAVAMAARASRGVAAPVRRAPSIERRVLRLAVERATRFQALKEEAKHHAMRKVAFLRALLLEIGDRAGIGEGVFQLTPAEVRRMREPAFRAVEAARVVRERQEEREALRDVHLPREITPAFLESLDVERSSELVPTAGWDGLRGTRVSGTGDVTGRVRTLRHAGEIDTFRRNEILVARFTDPTWTPVFPLARGIVTEVGGWLSHAAILAREYGITGIVGAVGALDRLRDGDVVTLRADGSIAPMTERRTEQRAPVSLPVDVQRVSGIVSARIADVSDHGALVQVPGSLAVGERVALDFPELRGSLAATVVRNGLPGIYGLRFERRLEPEHAVALGAPSANVVSEAV